MIVDNGRNFGLTIFLYLLYRRLGPGLQNVRYQLRASSSAYFNSNTVPIGADGRASNTESFGYFEVRTTFGS
jgi:hypothetical protein